MYSYGPPHMAEKKQDDQHEHTLSNYVRIRDVIQKTCQKRWTRGKSGKRGSGISVLPARHDDDDDNIFPKGICPKVNVIARLEYELAYYESAVHRFNHYTTRSVLWVCGCVCVCEREIERERERERKREWETEREKDRGSDRTFFSAILCRHLRVFLFMCSSLFTSVLVIHQITIFTSDVLNEV